MKLPDRIPGILPIPGFPGYAVTSQGNIWSFQKSKPRKLKLTVDKLGRLYVGLRAVGKVKKTAVHRAVLLAFVGPAPDGMECRHLNGKPKDNELTNLCWGTHTENMRDAVRHGTHKTSRLTNEQIRQIRTMPGLHKDIAAKFGISAPYVANLKSGKNGNYSLRARTP